MKIKSLNKRVNFNQNSTLNKRFLQFQELISALRNKELNEEIITTLNNNIDSINLLLDTDAKFKKQLKKSQAAVLKLIEKKLKLVVKHHYRNIWMSVGAGVFGIPIGIFFGIIFGNMAFIGMGMPIGFGIGMVIGIMMDQKSKEKGNQLDFEI